MKKPVRPGKILKYGRKLIDDAERALKRRLSDGERRDLLKDNTNWTSTRCDQVVVWLIWCEYQWEYRQYIHRHNGLMGSARWMRTVAQGMQSTPSLSENAKLYAANIEILADHLGEELRNNRIDPPNRSKS